MPLLRPNFLLHRSCRPSTRSLILPKHLTFLLIHTHTMSTTSPTPARTYASAITALNSLQSNFAILAAIRSSGKKMNDSAITEMLTWLSRIGYTPSDLNKLNLLHVAGTKGKGSTSAFISSILNQYRLSPSAPISKIGLYTSPHLRAVRERIQINGAPINESDFTKYFFEVWDRLEESAVKEGRDVKEKPVYFRFLTLVAFHAYMREGVDTAVIEVGIGGEYDSTNILESPTVVGITSLGIDHVGVLGDTICEIAWHKAGVFKKGVPACVVPQVEEAMEVIRRRAEERGVERLEVVEVGRWRGIADGKVRLGLEGEFQKGNAALAVGMVKEHFRRLGKESEIRDGEELPREVRKGLEEVKWAGRCQTVREGDLEWSIDGAHTVESLEAAGKWYGEKKREGVQNRVLIFNQQNRDAPEKLALALATSLKKALGSEDMFTHAIFCTNVTFKEAGYKPDLMSVGSDTAAVKELTVQKALAEAWKNQDANATTHVKATIQEAVELARSLEGKTQVLVTGSLHLVGGLLEVIDPENKL